MKLSTKSRYGLKAMVSLAEVYGQGPISAASLAELHGISFPYLEQLMASLKKAGLVQSQRGTQGGYVLSRQPAQINVGEVIAALEGRTTVADCVGYDPVECENACSCATRPLWLKLQNKINIVLQETTIKDMADDYIQQKERVRK